MSVTSLKSILNNFSVPDNAIRNQAEQQFELLKKENRDSLTVNLTALLSDNDLTIKSQAIAALKNIYKDFISHNETDLWFMLSDEAKNALKIQPFTLLKQESNESFRPLLISYVCDISAALIYIDQFPEFESYLDMFYNDPAPENQVICLTILNDILLSIEEFPVNHEKYSKLVDRLLALNSKNLTLTCIKYISHAALFQLNVAKKYYSKYVPLFGEITKAYAQEAHSTGESSDYEVMVNELISIIEASPRFIESEITVLLELMFNVASQHDFPSKGRVITLEFLLVYVERRRKKVSSDAKLLSRLVQVLITCMTEIEETDEWYSQALDALNTDDEVAEAAEIGIDRLGYCVDGSILMPIVFQKIAEIIQHDDWKVKSAALLAICQTIEFLPSDVAEMHLGDVMKLLIDHTTHPHYRVRFAAFHALAQVALDHKPIAQLHYHSIVIPVLTNAFVDEVPRVQAQALAAFINYVEDVEPEDFSPFLENVMGLLVAKLDASWTPNCPPSSTPNDILKIKYLVYEQCITALSALVAVLGQRFVESYPDIIPFMKNFVSANNTPQTLPLCARSMEFLTILAFCTRDTLLNEHKREICNILVSIFNSPNAEDKKIKEYMYEAVKRMAKSLGTDFITYAPTFVNYILEEFNLNNVKQKLEQIDDDIDNTDNYACNTAVSEELTNNLTLLAVIIESCEANYTTMYDQTMGAIGPLLMVSLPYSIRIKLVSVFAALLLVLKKSQTPKEHINATLDDIITKTCDSLTELSNDIYFCTDSWALIMEELRTCVKNAGYDVLSHEQISKTVSQIFGFIDSSVHRSEKTKKAINDSNIEDYERDYLTSDLEGEQLFREACLVFLEGLIKYNKFSFNKPLLKEVVTFAERYADKQNPQERVIGLYICADLLSHFDKNCLPILVKLLELAFANVNSPHANITRCSTFIIAQLLLIKDLDISTVERVANTLIKSLNCDEAKSKDRLPASENSVSGLINLLNNYHQNFTNIVADLYALIFKFLPLKQEPAEAESVHDTFFCDLLPTEPFIQSKIVSPGYNDYKRVIYLVALELYKSENSSEACDNKIEQLLQAFFADKETEAQLKTLTLTVVQQRGLKKILADK